MSMKKLRIAIVKLHPTHILLCFLCAALSLYVLRFELFSLPIVGTYPTTFLELVVFLVFLSWLWEGFLRKPVSRLRLEFLAPAALLLFSGAISVFVSPARRAALGALKAYLLEPILIYFVIRSVARTREALLSLLASLLFSGLWLSILTVLQGFLGMAVFNPYELALGRPTAVYNTANALGLYLGPLLLVSLSLLVGVYRRKFKTGRKTFLWELFLVLGLGTVSLWLSKSTGALLGFLAGILVVVTLTYSLWWGREGVGSSASPERGSVRLSKILPLAPAVAAFLALVFIFLAVPQLAPESTSPPRRVSNNTTVIRFCLWEGTRNMLLEKPLFGTGLAGFKLIYKDYRTCDDELLEYPHDLFLNFWSELGLLGLLSFLWICARWVALSLKLLQSGGSGYRGVVGCSILAVLAYWFVHGAVDVPYFKNDLALEFWILLAITEGFLSS